MRFIRVGTLAERNRTKRIVTQGRLLPSVHVASPLETGVSKLTSKAVHYLDSVAQGRHCLRSMSRSGGCKRHEWLESRYVCQDRRQRQSGFMPVCAGMSWGVAALLHAHVVAPPVVRSPMRANVCKYREGVRAFAQHEGTYHGEEDIVMVDIIAEVDVELQCSFFLPPTAVGAQVGDRPGGAHIALAAYRVPAWWRAEDKQQRACAAL
jgi:hypothetical protein